MTTTNDDRALRPQRLVDFTGQTMARKRLFIALIGALKNGRTLEHTLLSGPPGLGKTTLAQIIATELGTSIVITSGPALKTPADLLPTLAKLRRGDVLFIDEIHRMPTIVKEALYGAMEDFVVDLVVAKQPVRTRLNPFTLIGATTHAGMLPGPMRDRFGLDFALTFYSDDELASIVERSARLLGVAIEHDAALCIASRSRGTPRIANKLLRRAHDFADYANQPAISLPVVEQALLLEGIDDAGLDDLDRQYLQTLLEYFDGGPAGLEAIAAAMQLEAVTLDDMVEPYLLSAGYVRRTPRGRQATPKAYAHLGVAALAAA
jgi:holliday junction DNA helicase RuvB